MEYVESVNYFVLTPGLVADKSVAIIAAPTDEELGVELWEIDEGVALKRRLKKELVVRIDAEFPGKRLVDLQTCTWGGFVVSARFAAILAKEPRAELLPLRIADKRGKVIASDYSLVNFLGTVRCVDMKASQVSVNPFDRTRVTRIEKMVLDEKKIPASRLAFRLSVRPQTVLLHKKLVAEIAKQKLLGIRCIPTPQYDSTGLVGV